MGPLFAYSISCSVLLALMYMAYKWVLASENQHRFNRIVLWSIYLVSLSAIPLGGVADRWLADSSEDLPAGLIEVGGIMMLPVAEDSASLADIICSAILWIYVSGMVVAMLHTGVVAVRLALIVRSGSGADACGQRVILIRDEGIAPFSVMGAIVMSHKDYAESGEMIVAHECCHVRHRHWVDLVMAQLVAVFQWYNPAAWLMREELKAVHEYQADSGVISSGVNPREYQMLLIKKAVGARFPSLANSLNHSKLKKRITMMYNPKTSASRRLRVLALAPAFAAAVLVTDIPAVAGAIDSASGASLSAVMPAEAVAAVTESKVTKNTSAGQPGLFGRQDAAVAPASDKKVRTKNLEEIVVVGYGTAKKTSTPEAGRVNGNACDGEEMGFDVVDEALEYPGGQVELMKFIAKNIRYPHDAMKDSIEGNVVVRFIVGNDGKVSSPEIVRGVCPSIDAEALRVVSSLPALKPARMKGKPVELWYNLPIAFRLTGNDQKKLIASIGTNSSRGMVAVELNGDEKDVTFIVDGVRVESIRDIDQSTIERVKVWKDETNPLYVKYKTPIVEIILKK